MATTALMDSVKLVGRRGLLAPFLVLVALAMLMLPLPAFVLDLLFSFNIAFSLVILLAVIYAQRPLDLAAIPTVLLAGTLPRLALNELGQSSCRERLIQIVWFYVAHQQLK